MPTILLKERANHVIERMDDPACDEAKLKRTYAQFALINDLVSAWRQIYRQRLRPHFKNDGVTTVLDIGFGGGDIPRRLAQWAQRDGYKLELTAIDPDPRAIAFAKTKDYPDTIRFHCLSAEDLARRGERFDLVISNHVLHHLSAENIHSFCQTSADLANKVVLHNDIRRSDLAFALFPLLGLVFHRSFTIEDGLRSIRRSFTPSELAPLVPEGWQAKPFFPFRNLVTLEK